MAQVIEIKFADTLRQITFQKASEILSFAQLQTCIRELFQIPATAELALSYTDKESNVLTMANDQDLKDAVVDHCLNPLSLAVTVVDFKLMPGPSSPSRNDRKSMVADHDAAQEPLEQLFKKLSPTPEDAMKDGTQSYEPFFPALLKGVPLPSPAQIPGVLENVAAMITSQLASAANDEKVMTPDQSSAVSQDFTLECTSVACPEAAKKSSASG